MRHEALLLTLALTACRPREPLRVGTYNIRNLGAEPTDLERLARVIVDVRPAALALQEVVDGAALTALEARLSAQGAPRFAHLLARCGGKRTLHVGFLYDTTRVKLERAEEFPGLAPDGDGACDGSDRAGLAANRRAINP